MEGGFGVDHRVLGAELEERPPIMPTMRLPAAKVRTPCSPSRHDDLAVDDHRISRLILERGDRGLSEGVCHEAMPTPIVSAARAIAAPSA